MIFYYQYKMSLIGAIDQGTSSSRFLVSELLVIVVLYLCADVCEVHILQNSAVITSCFNFTSSE